MKSEHFLICILVLVIFSLFSCERKSGRRNSQNSEQNIHSDRFTDTTSKSLGKTIVKMENEDGVTYIFVEINGLKLKFIFDTGASNLCLSSAEATVLYRQGTLLKDDILDVQYFQDATGNVSEGTRINLRSVKIGDRILKNIEAIVIDNNDAPLLLGQSALEKFGKISIDNNKGIIIFE
jgi:aspartyl protease family protein